MISALRGSSSAGLLSGNKETHVLLGPLMHVLETSKPVFRLFSCFFRPRVKNMRLPQEHPKAKSPNILLLSIHKHSLRRAFNQRYYYCIVMTRGGGGGRRDRAAGQSERHPVRTAAPSAGGPQSGREGSGGRRRGWGRGEGWSISLVRQVRAIARLEHTVRRPTVRFFNNTLKSSFLLPGGL